MRYEGMGIADLIFAPLLILFLYAISWVFVKARYEDPGTRKLFIQGLSLKFFGCICFCLIYQFYYGGGDTFRYFANSTTLVNLFYDQPSEYFSILFRDDMRQYPLPHLYGITNMFRDESTFVVVKIASIFGIIFNNTFLLTSLMFAFCSYIGVWALYRTIFSIYQTKDKLLAIPILFIPSYYFWGSGIMQDTLILGFLGLLTYCSYQIFLLRRLKPYIFILLIAALIILLRVKQYVIIAYLPALSVWLILSWRKNISNVRLRLLLGPAAIAMIVAGLFIGLPLISSISSDYQVNAILERAEITANYIYRVSEIKDGSAYNLNIEFTPVGLITAFPKAVNVSLFRPYLWEVRNPVMLLGALESLAFLLFTLFFIFKLGFIKLIRQLVEDPFLFFALSFSVVFAFAVGASTYNFGALARYKIPMIPYYGTFLIVCYLKYRNSFYEASNIELKTPL